ncbi:MAG: CDP-alcohol phosphatidyltransferase family protein [Pirellulales bacterium]|nr:CDP-alcohol phosphatidyltransferase family protein [Pirellulales bacterium]
MLYTQKGNFQKFCRWIGGRWMTANQATALGIFFVLLASGSFYAGLTFEGFRWVLLLAPVMLLLRMAMNTLDGMLSREYGTATVAGELWNETLDIVGDTLCYGSLLFIPDSPRPAVTVFLVLTWAAEYFGVLGKSMPGGQRRHETFLGGKPDRAVWMSLLAVILYFSPAFQAYLGYYLLGVSALILLTCVIRVRMILKQAKGQPYESFTWVGK